MNWVQGQQLQNGKYVIEKELGRGGFGITYKARHTFLNYDVVIKTPNEQVKSDPDYAKYVERFIKEGRMLAQLSKERHPHIVRISDLFREGDTHCLVMDFISGESLWNLVGRRGALSETEAVEYIRQIGSALSVVHQQNLVHLDVTPPNIMVRNTGKAVLIDFGIAADMSPPSTLSRTFGNQAFVPYELRKGRRHPTVDIYCLAASLYYAVTGQCPTKSFDRKYEGVELKAPKRLVPQIQISDEVNRAILKGMELEPEKRPQSMQEWLKLLEPKQVAPVSTPQPVQPSPQRSGLRNGNSIPRHRLNYYIQEGAVLARVAVVALTLSVALTLLLGVLFAWVGESWIAWIRLLFAWGGWDELFFYSVVFLFSSIIGIYFFYRT
jgi:serine/threonine-protein kinase